MLSGKSDLLNCQRELYKNKNDLLNQFYEQVDAYDFYRYIFPEGTFERKGHYEDNKPNAIAVSLDKVFSENGIAVEVKRNGKGKRYTITDELTELNELCKSEFTIMSPISYYGKHRSGKNARYLFALVFDLDGVGMSQLRDVLHQMDKEILPKATFVVNSGTGLHLYYVLDEAVPMYPQNQLYMKELKYALTRQIWNRFTSTIEEPQMQGIMQGFRVVGTCTKLGADYPVIAYAVGDRISLNELLEYIPASNGEQQYVKSIMMKSRLSLEEAKEKYPEWYEKRIVRKERRGRWVIKPDLYYWWLNRIKDEIKVGHRFYGIMTLAIYAKKCCIPFADLQRDAFSLLDIYDDMSIEDINRFTEDDIQCALEMYNEDYVTFPRDDISKLSGLKIEKNKRNGRNQEEHLKRCRIIQMANDTVDGTNWRDGNGRKSKKDVIYEFMKLNPNQKNKSAIARKLNLSRPTVTKYYDEIVKELSEERLRNERLKQLERDGNISVKVIPSQELSDYIVNELNKKNSL